MDNIENKNKQLSIIREFGITTFSIKNRTSVFILLFLIVLTGIMAYSSMPRESYPEIVQPTIYVGTIYPGNSPNDIENLVTRPIEKELKGLTGIKNLTSTSIQDYSTIIVEFAPDKDVKNALQEVKDAVDRSKSELPTDLDVDPNIFELDFSKFPIMTINLSGDYSVEDLKENAEYLQEKIEEISQISEAEIKGTIERQVNIEIDPYKMDALFVSYYDIEQALQQENVTVSGGDLLTDGVRRNIRVIGEFVNMQQIGDVIIKRDKGNIIYLKDIATTSFGFKDPESFARMDGKNVVSLEIKKQAGENIIAAADSIYKIVAVAKATKFPKGLNIKITGDFSKKTNTMVSDLENNIISGVILVIVIIMFFMGLTNALFIGIAIPVSMFLAFFILNAMGVTLNMMVLFSLILALGMLVDNGIVVIENIYRLREEGYSMIEAAKFGTGEVAIPIISSTATTVAAFLPLLFWKDTMGEFMKFLPITLIVVLSSSLFVALVINPVISSLYIDTEDGKVLNKRKFWLIFAISFLLGLLFTILGHSKEDKSLISVGTVLLFFATFYLLNRFVLSYLIRQFKNVFLVRLEKAYGRFIYFTLKGWRPFFLFIFLMVLMVFSTMLYFGSKPTVLFFPESDPLYVNAFIDLPIGTDITETNELTKIVEQRIVKAVENDKEIVEAIVAQVGKGTSDPSQGPESGASPNKARVTVSFVDFVERNGKSTSVVMENIRKGLKGIPGANITVDKDPVGPPVGKPIQIEISGEDYDELILLTEEIKKELTNLEVPGVEGLQTDLEIGKPELQIDVDRDAARRFGLSTGQVAMEIRTAIFGKEVSKYKMGEDDYPIVLRSNDKNRYDLSSVLNKKISFMDQSTGQLLQIPINTLATINYGSSFGSIHRKDSKRVITIYSNVNKGFTPNEIIPQYETFLSQKKLPDGYTYTFAGEQQEQDESSAFLGNAFLIALFLVFLIIVAQFNSVTSPFIIMFSIFFSTIGVFIGLWATNMPFVVMMTGIGVISLAGVVVNNAIVLIDYAMLLKERKKMELGLESHEHLTIDELIDTLAKAGATRLKPVLLTAITTVLGLIPLAIGINIDFASLISTYDPKIFIGGDSVAFWAPMSWTVIFGLSFATIVTLVAIPAMVLMIEKLSGRYKKGIR
ncbi:MAG: efflux RND transporter permease subunit [Bacteroidetes bacterium]|nr:efflux RND transporter permease subunit [Bacteroidota bacterium]